MIKYFKADSYKIYKEKRFLGSTILCVLLALVFSYFMRDNRGEDGLLLTLSSLATFVPLFFTTPAMFFWGDDFSSRTINTMLIKSKNRFSLFLYKVLATLLCASLYVIITFIVVASFRTLVLGESVVRLTVSLSLYQAPYYLYIMLLSIFIFNYVDKAYQANLVYVVIVLLFDNLLSYISGSLLDTEVLNQFLLFNQLRAVTGSGDFLTGSVAVAISFSILYFILSYSLFNAREFK